MRLSNLSHALFVCLTSASRLPSLIPMFSLKNCVFWGAFEKGELF